MLTQLVIAGATAAVVDGITTGVVLGELLGVVVGDVEAAFDDDTVVVELAGVEVDDETG